MISDTVLIVELNGTVRARATFTPRKATFVGNAAALLQPEARVAVGKVYYQDGAGAIRSLAPDGTIADVTAFGISSPQQVLSFAVDPDGSRLMATVLTLPPVVTDANTGRPTLAAGPFKIEVRVSAGGTITVVRQESFTPSSLAQPGPSGALMLAMVGWDSQGPLATVNTMLGTQASLQGRRWYGQATHLDSAGQPAGAILGGSDCWAWAALDDGTTLCTDANQTVASLRTSAGTVLHTLPPGQYNSYAYLTLAPGGASFTYADSDCGSATVVNRANVKTSLPAGFCPQGWFDAQTVVGTATGLGHLAIVRLAQPNAIEDLGVSGLFVGTM